MYYLIETNEQLESFSKYDLSDSFIEPILYSDVVHTVLNMVCAYYIKPSRSRTGFILPINHSETFSLSEESILSLFEDRVTKVYVSDIKRVKCHLAITKPLICLKTLKWLSTGEVLDDSKWNTTAHTFFYSKYPDKVDVNRIVPVIKHQEKWNNYIASNKNLLTNKIQSKKYFKFYNELVNDTLLSLEYEGLSIDMQSFSRHYVEVNPINMSADGKMYTSYNINTATGRPSNTFNGVNFGAMNKSDDSREFIVASSEDNFLVEFDYNSYHPKILANLIGYEFDGDDIHSHLAETYYGTDELTLEQYEEGKKITFKALYTTASEYNHIPFFRQVKEYKETLWKEYKERGYFEATISKRPITDITSKTQILPYLLQSYETERNVLIMNELQLYLSNKKTKFILYSYDAFLIDWDIEDGYEVVDHIQSMLETDGFTTSVKIGKNYASLKHLSD